MEIITLTIQTPMGVGNSLSVSSQTTLGVGNQLSVSSPTPLGVGNGLSVSELYATAYLYREELYSV